MNPGKIAIKHEPVPTHTTRIWHTIRDVLRRKGTRAQLLRSLDTNRTHDKTDYCSKCPIGIFPSRSCIVRWYTWLQLKDQLPQWAKEDAPRNVNGRLKSNLYKAYYRFHNTSTSIMFQEQSSVSPTKGYGAYCSRIVFSPVPTILLLRIFLVLDQTQGVYTVHKLHCDRARHPIGLAQQLETAWTNHIHKIPKVNKAKDVQVCWVSLMFTVFYAHVQPWTNTTLIGP